MQHVLLVEDAKDCQLIVSAALDSTRFKIEYATTLKEAKEKLAAHHAAPFDLILLDLGLPDGDGLSLLECIQTDSVYKHVPTLLLTGTTEISNKVTAFTMGADDYLTKPVNGLELRARVELRLRKANSRKQQDVISKGNLRLDLQNLRATISGDEGDVAVDLTPKEFRLLSYLAQHEDATFTRTQLVEAIWGKDVHVLDRTIDSHICAIRRKLKPVAHYIESLAGSGYRFRIQERNRSAA